MNKELNGKSLMSAIDKVDKVKQALDSNINAVLNYVKPYTIPNTTLSPTVEYNVHEYTDIRIHVAVPTRYEVVLCTTTINILPQDIESGRYLEIIQEKCLELRSDMYGVCVGAEIQSVDGNMTYEPICNKWIPFNSSGKGWGRYKQLCCQFSSYIQLKQCNTVLLISRELRREGRTIKDFDVQVFERDVDAAVESLRDHDDLVLYFMAVEHPLTNSTVHYEVYLRPINNNTVWMDYPVITLLEMGN